MTPDEEYEFYSRHVNHIPQGPARRLASSGLSDPIPVRFPSQVLTEIRRRAAADDRTVAAWIRQIVETEVAGS